MSAILTYIENAPSPKITCSICLEPVAQKAVKISCHEALYCSQCIGYWMESQIDARGRASCPSCRTFVDSSNMQIPATSLEWEDFEEMEWEEEIDEEFFHGDFYDDEAEEYDDIEQDLSDDEGGDEEMSGVTTAEEEEDDDEDPHGEVNKDENSEVKVGNFLGN